MPTICPAILADSPEKYEAQIKKVADFAHRLQIDLTDGQFATSRTVTPEEAWWPAGVQADLHLMYKQPAKVAPDLLKHGPHMIIVHAEADGNFNELADICHQMNVKVGVALLAPTSPEVIFHAIDKIDHVLIFSGELGSYGGRADLRLLEKVGRLKGLKSQLEIGWDGGVNDQNISALVSGGIDVLNVGGFIQNAEDAGRTFSALQRIADETGTT